MRNFRSFGAIFANFAILPFWVTSVVLKNFGDFAHKFLSCLQFGSSSDYQVALAGDPGLRCDSGLEGELA